MTHADAPFPDKVGKRSSSGKLRPAKKSLPLWQETLLLLTIALGLAVVIKMFFIQAFYIPSPSMEPEFIKNDRILVQKMSYWGDGKPQRGDIIVFKDPGGWLTSVEGAAPKNPVIKVLERIGLYPTGGHLVKRVIGVGGDRVACCDKQGRVTVNGTPLDESSYLPKGVKPSLTVFDIKVKDGHLWMMGDNRGDSWDSRGHMGDPGGGNVSEDLVVGKVFALVWPWDRAEWVKRPASFETVNKRAP